MVAAKQRYVVCEKTVNGKKLYTVQTSYDWEPQSGIGWIYRGSPCSYRTAMRRVKILNRGRVTK